MKSERKPLWVATVESEEGAPIQEVLTRLAAEGESKSSAAAILDVPQTTLCYWLRNNPQLDSVIGWPPKNKSNGVKAQVACSTEARQKARLRNLALSRNHR